MTTVAVLHPGSMGAAVAHQLTANADAVLWLPRERGPATTERAARAGLTPIDDPAELFDRADVVLSICPPGPAADSVADLALSHRFRGIFVDANAISPQRMTRMADRLAAAGVNVVDGSIIGGPPSPTSRPSLYLCGESPHVKVLVDLLAGSSCQAQDLARPIGAASALKAAYASYTKATSVLGALSHALAAHHGLQGVLLDEAIESVGGTPLAVPGRLTGAAGKAWRWIPEFGEIADAYADAGLPPEVSRAVGVVLGHWADLKDDSAVSLEEVLDHLRTPPAGQAAV